MSKIEDKNPGSAISKIRNMDWPRFHRMEKYFLNFLFNQKNVPFKVSTDNLSNNLKCQN